MSIMYQLVPRPRISTTPMKAARSPSSQQDRQSLLHLVKTTR
jgi:hypothetical protein